MAAAFDALANPDKHAKILIDPHSDAAEPVGGGERPMTESQTDQSIVPAGRGRNPFDAAGVERGSDGVARYTNLPDSLVHMLRASVERDPEARAVAEVGGEALSYGELWDRAARVAGGLRAAGLQRGDRAAILLPNGVEWVLAFWGAQLAGVVAVPVNTRFKEPEIEYVVSDSGARYVFRPGEALPDGEPVEAEDAGANELAAIFYTSGTTGFPKGAMTSHANFLANIENAVRCVGIDRAEGPELATLINVPLFHVTGCNSQLLVMAALGGRAFILANALDLDGFLQTVSEERIQMLTSVPAIYHALTRHPRFCEDRPRPRPLGLLRRRADRRRRGAHDHGGVPRAPASATGSGSPRPRR